MASEERLVVENRFDVRVPRGWTHEPDEEGGVLLSSGSEAGLLHMVSFEQTGGEVLDPAEELYAFLEDQGLELEEDEVEDLELAGGSELAYCEYLTEEEEDEAADGDESSTFWLVGVATAPGGVVFCSYSCPAGSQDTEREGVLEILRSIRLLPRDEAGPGR
jgi:hypothetical protein